MAKNDGELVIMEVVRGHVDFCILGTSPLIFNRMSQKVKFGLLAPRGRKTAADKAAGPKHDPVQEYRDSVYRHRDPDSPTALALLPTMFKRGMATAALDLPGASRTQIGRLVSVDWNRIPLYGIPQLFMAVTRSADIKRTPDIRTRAILPEWACTVSIEFMKPILNEQSIANLLAAAGFLSGVCDWRQEKGSGNYGCYRIVSAKDPDFIRITKTQGKNLQNKALAQMKYYDDETEELMNLFDVEMKRRGFKVAA
jgi:hypothetical protein